MPCAPAGALDCAIAGALPAAAPDSPPERAAAAIAPGLGSINQALASATMQLANAAMATHNQRVETPEGRGCATGAGVIKSIDDNKNPKKITITHTM